MRFYWMRDRVRQHQFHIYWRRGVDGKFFNLADYPTKHHPTSHHRAMRPTYVLNNIYEIFSDPTTTTPVALHLQRKTSPSLSTQNSILPLPQRKFFFKRHRRFSIQNLRNNLVLPCKGVLEPIPANPSRVGTRISPKIQTNTRTTKWRQGTAITQLINSPSKPGDESGSTSTSNTIGCKPHKYSRACSHPLSTIIHNLQLA